MPFRFLRRASDSSGSLPQTAQAGILAVLDQGCKDFVFPMLDNGYVYLAAARLSAHRSETDWALVFEIFGFSPRSGAPDVSVWSLGSRLANRKTAADFVNQEAYRNYLRVHAHDDAAFFYPLGEGWQDHDDVELVAENAASLTVRDKEIAIPTRNELHRVGIEPSELDRLRTFELCRYVAGVERELVLATPAERRTHVPADLEQILVLDDWHHPDLLTGQLASDTASFRSIADVLATADVGRYDPSEPGNTHWSNWPDGGSL